MGKIRIAVIAFFKLLEKQFSCYDFCNKNKFRKGLFLNGIHKGYL